MRLRPLLVAGAAVLAASLLAAACGDDGGSDAATPTTTVAPAPEPVPSGAPSPSTTAPPTGDLRAASVRLVPVVAGLQQPVFLTQRAGDTALYVTERVGTVRAVRDGVALDPPVLDIRSGTVAQGEQGLLSASFSPDGSKLYVDYTDRNGDSHIDEYAVSTRNGVAVADPASRRELLVVDQPYPNHNGGLVTFGPDGYLWIGFGDGGSAGDPQNRAQDLSTLLGKVLRIDPTPSGDQPYSIPAGNPFVGVANARPEIWLYGVRNPWRFAFDPATGDLWIGDVGQGSVEEIDHLSAAAGRGRGVNLGWRRFEGDQLYSSQTQAPGAVGPVLTYDHSAGGCSITGGYVYRGTRVATLQGAFLYGDYCIGDVDAVALGADGTVATQRGLGVSVPAGSLVSFGQDAAGEVYVLSFDGSVERIDAA